MQTLFFMSDEVGHYFKLHLQPTESQDHDQRNFLSSDQLQIPNAFHWKGCDKEVCNRI